MCQDTCDFFATPYDPETPDTYEEIGIPANDGKRKTHTISCLSQDDIPHEHCLTFILDEKLVFHQKVVHGRQYTGLLEKELVADYGGAYAAVQDTVFQIPVHGIAGCTRGLVPGLKNTLAVKPVYKLHLIYILSDELIH